MHRVPHKCFRDCKEFFFLQIYNKLSLTQNSLTVKSSTTAAAAMLQRRGRESGVKVHFVTASLAPTEVSAQSIADCAT